MGQCGLIDFYYGYSFKDDDIGVDVEVSDDSGLSITVKTGENFGCIKHEIK